MALARGWAVVQRLLRTLIVLFPSILGRSWLVRISAESPRDNDPWKAVEVLGLSFDWETAMRIVLDPASVPAPQLVQVLHAQDPLAADYAQRAALGIIRKNPAEAKTTLMTELLGGRRYPALDLVPEVASVLTDANLVLAASLSDALMPLNPYADDGIASAGRAIAAVIANYPSLVDTVTSAAGADLDAQAIAGDLVILGVARDALLKPEQLPALAKLIAKTPDEFAERIRLADNRYSTSDRLDSEPDARWSLGHLLQSARQLRSRYATIGFRQRLFVVLALDAVALVFLIEAADSLKARGANLPDFDLGESLTAAGLLIALHVLAVELASGSLPTGLVAKVAWPVRLVSAYVVASILVLAILLPDVLQGLSLAAGTLLLAHMPFVAQDLVAKSDLRRAVARVSRDRSRDMVVAGARAGKAFTTRQRVKKTLASTSRIRRASTEPVTRRRLPIHSPRRGYTTFDVMGLVRINSLLIGSEDSPLTTGRRPPSLVLLQDAGGEVLRGDLIAVVEVDEPEVGEIAAKLAMRYLAVEEYPAVDRARDTVAALSDVLNRQAGNDRSGAQLTSIRIQELLTRFLDNGERVVGNAAPHDGYLQSLLPFNPELEAVRGFETLWVRAIGQQDETEQEALRLHALRLARLSQTCRFSSFVDFLIVRLDVVARETSAAGVHPCAALIAELAALASDAGRRESFFPARAALEGLLDRLSVAAQPPREEELVRQRFEEMLARGLIADYFLETQVERGCRKLVALATSAAPRRKVRVALGIAKVGTAALYAGRFALAARLAFLLRDADTDFADARAKLIDDSYRVRMSALSDMAGGVFGADVGTAVSRYLDWAEAILDAYPAPLSVDPR